MTERLFLFLVTNWADGLTHEELSEATGLSSWRVSRALKHAHLLLPERLEQLPGVLGIDEIQLQKKYYSVITDLSHLGETRLVDIVPGRPEAQSRLKMETSELLDELFEVNPPDEKIEVGETPDTSELKVALRALAKRYVSDETWHTPSGQLITPILTTDGWWQFKELTQNCFVEVAEEAGMTIGKLGFVADLFHLQRGLQKQKKTALAVIESAAERALNTRLNALSRLRKRVTIMTSTREARAGLIEALRLEDKQKSIASHRVHLRLDQLDESPEEQDVLQLFHSRIRENVNASGSSAEHIDIWMALLQTAFSQLTAAVKAENAEELQSAVRLNEKVVAAGKKVLESGSQTCFVDWLRALREFDSHPFTLMKHGGYSYRALDLRLVKQYWNSRVRNWEPTPFVRELEESASIRYIHPVDKPSALKGKGLHESEIRWAMSVVKKLRHPSRSISFRNPELRFEVDRLNNALKGKVELFRSVRPSNSYTERLNRSIRLRLMNSSSNSEFTELRIRLLCGLSGALPQPHQIEAAGQLSIFRGSPPSECPRCKHGNLQVVNDNFYEELHRDVPIGWQPTTYLKRTSLWTCTACKHSSPRTKNPQLASNTPELTAYVEGLANAPRHVGLPVALWTRRTGVPAAQLKPYLDGPVGFQSPTIDDPAIVIGLAVTSDYRKDNSKNKKNRKDRLPLIGPRVLIADLRHRAAGSPVPTSPLPARIVAHKRMHARELISRLKYLHEIAGQQLVLMVDDTMWYKPGFMKALEAAGNNESRWRIGVDGYQALQPVKWAARRLEAYWLRNTRTKVVKPERRARSSTNTGNKKRAQRELNKAEMSKFFTVGLNPPPTDADKSKKKVRQYTPPEDLLTILEADCDATKDVFYSPGEIVEIHAILCRWWGIIINKKGYSHAQLHEDFRQLLNEPWNVEAPALKELHKQFINKITPIIYGLLNTKNLEGDLINPDTKTLDFNMAQIGRIKHKIKIESARRGNIY